ncbi:hypothetical protein GCM10028895_26540 [Pontibacter rugosus]
MLLTYQRLRSICTIILYQAAKEHIYCIPAALQQIANLATNQQPEMKLIRIPFILLLLLSANFAYAQTCDCESNFEWVKKTFEENDAGFRYALEQKGTQAYEDHNKRTLAKVKAAKSLSDCTPVLYEWLKFLGQAISPSD